MIKYNDGKYTQNFDRASIKSKYLDLKLKIGGLSVDRKIHQDRVNQLNSEILALNTEFDALQLELDKDPNKD